MRGICKEEEYRNLQPSVLGIEGAPGCYRTGVKTCLKGYVCGGRGNHQQ